MKQFPIGFDSYDSMEGIAAIEVSAPPRPFESWPRAKLIHAVYPGLLVAGTIALASTWLAQHYTAPVMLFALLFGMAFHFLHEEGRCVAGIEFSSRSVLRLGVALLGVRITLGQIASLGVAPVATVIVGVASTIIFGMLLARRLGLTKMFGVLSGGAVAICGASAALAIASVLPRDENSERDSILTVVSVTALSTLAMILYPVFATSIGLDHKHAGVFIGGSIHDVAQVVGAGYAVSPETGDIATYVKLLRVAMLLPTVFVISLLAARSGGGAGARPRLPMFLICFALLVLANSFGLLPRALIDFVNEVSRWCLVAAIAALGMKTSFKALFAAGLRPVGLMVAETMWIGIPRASFHQNNDLKAPRSSKTPVQATHRVRGSSQLSFNKNSATLRNRARDDPAALSPATLNVLTRNPFDINPSRHAASSVPHSLIMARRPLGLFVGNHWLGGSVEQATGSCHVANRLVGSDLHRNHLLLLRSA